MIFNRKERLLIVILFCLIFLPAVSVQAVDVKKGDTVTDGTFTYIILTKAGKSKDGTVSVYGLNKNVFDDNDKNQKNDSPKKLTVPTRLKYNGGYYNITATGSSGKATLAGSSSDYQYYWGNVVKLELPDTITLIGDNSFAKAEKLKTVNIPSKVTAIGGEAFSDTNITKIEIPESVEIIGRAAFWKCKKLKNVTFNKGVKTIGKWAFQQSGITKAILPEGLEEMKQAAFSKCSSLKEVNLPSTVNTIGAGIFSGCDRLKKVTVDEENENYQSDHQAIYTKNDNMVLVDGGGVKGAYQVLEGTEVIGKCAFESNQKLTSITMRNTVKTVKEGAFLNCKKLKKAVIGEKVTKLSVSSFAKCSSLKKIEIPEKVKRIEDNAFYQCSAMETMTMGDGVSLIGSHAFAECESLIEVEIPGTVSEIGERAFYQDTSLTSLQLNEGIKTIGKETFAYCNLTTVYLPETMISIENAAFQGNKALEEIEIPASVTKISDNVFASCKNLSGLEVAEENEDYCSLDGAIFNKNGNKLIAWPSAEGAVVLDDMVTTIGSYAFQDTDINSLILPSSVIKIEDGAFAFCEELLWVKFGSNETLLPEKVKNKDGSSSAIFYGCFALQTVSAPEIDEDDEIQEIFAKRLKKHMDKNGVLAWLQE